jgi:hypothetical protein
VTIDELLLNPATRRDMRIVGATVLPDFGRGTFTAGLPLGVLGGRAAWTVFANRAGVAPQATVPLSTVPLTIPVTLLLANLIAAWPGWQAARLRPATVLRTE